MALKLSAAVLLLLQPLLSSSTELSDCSMAGFPPGTVDCSICDTVEPLRTLTCLDCCSSALQWHSEVTYNKATLFSSSQDGGVKEFVEKSAKKFPKLKVKDAMSSVLELEKKGAGGSQQPIRINVGSWKYEQIEALLQRKLKAKESEE